MRVRKPKTKAMGREAGGDLPNLHARIFGEPLAVAPSPHLDTVLGYLLARCEGRRPTNAAAESQRAERAARNERPAVTSGGRGQAIALLPITGSLAARGGVDADSERVLGYGEIRQQLRAALADQSVGGILLDVDSYGGEVAGLPELAAEILAARDQKPIFALANTKAFSAAYWLASSAERVFVTPSGAVGSIGVIAAHRDQSAKDTADGVRWTFITAGEQKLDGNPHAALPDDVRGRIQARINATYSAFVDHVAKARELAPAAVRDTKAGVLTAQEALRVGLVTDVGTYDDAINALAAHMAEGRTTGAGGAGAKAMLKFEDLDEETQAFVRERDAKAEAEKVAVQARLEAAEKKLADHAAVEKARAEAAATKAIEDLKTRACDAGSPVPEADLEKVRAAFKRGDPETAGALIEAFALRAEALGGGPIRSSGSQLGGGPAEKGDREALDKDDREFRARWGLGKKE
jgi:signal peptide peptidase SppA